MRVATLVLLLAAVACQTSYDNPFLPPAASPVPAGATVLFIGNGHDTSRNAPRELFAIDDRGGSPTRLTTCSSRAPACEVQEVAPAPDRNRVAVRRRVDGDRDGDFDADEDDGIYVVDLARGVEGQTIPPKGITSLDWSPVDDLVVYSAPGEGGLEDLFSAFANGSEDGNRTATADVRERRFRFHPRDRVLVYERSQPGQRTEVWLYQNLLLQRRLTAGVTDVPAATLPGTHYLVGSDTDPDIDPALTGVVFRRLTGLGERGRGTWDVLTVDGNGANLRVVAAGPAYRSAPDWGPKGIMFSETPVGGASASLVVVDETGARRIVMTQPAAFALESPRWLP
jgi:dipeptidyl aminopeptidase/acylaminoacyl peptidase